MNKKYYTQKDINRLYEELKDVNIEDYIDETGECLIGAVATPISEKVRDNAYLVASMFPKDSFDLFTGPNSISFVGQWEKYLYSLYIYKDSVVGIIIEKDDSLKIKSLYQLNQTFTEEEDLIKYTQEFLETLKIYTSN